MPSILTDPLPTNWIRRLGNTSVSTSAIIAGSSPLGTMLSLYGYAVAEADAIDLDRSVAHELDPQTGQHLSFDLGNHRGFFPPWDHAVALRLRGRGGRCHRSRPTGTEESDSGLRYLQRLQRRRERAPDRRRYCRRGGTARGLHGDHQSGRTAR